VYAQHAVGIIIPLFWGRPPLRETIASLPLYVDRIYLVGDSIDKHPSVIGTQCIDNPRVICLPNGDTVTSEGALASTIEKALSDNLDIICIAPVVEQLPPYLAFILESIIFNHARYLQLDLFPGKEITDLYPPTSAIVSELASLSLDHIYRRCTALSRDGAEHLAELLSHEGKRVLVAIPCYNEEIAIGSMVLGAKKYVDEVLVVDDASTDATASVAHEAGATVVSHAKNLGYGGAIRTCFAYAREHNFDAMITLDGDGQHSPTFIPNFLTEMKRNGSDIIVGSRFLTGTNGSIPRYRQAGMKILDRATKMAEISQSPIPRAGTASTGGERSNGLR